MSDIVERLRGYERGGQQWVAAPVRLMGEAAAEIERLRGEVASLRLTLGGKTFCASVPEPIGCPAPGACAQVAEIERLRAALREIREQGYLIGLEADDWPVADCEAALAGRDEAAP